MAFLAGFVTRLAAVARGLLIATLIGGTATVPSRLSAEGYESWSKIESAAETRDYVQQLKEGKFEPSQRAYISKVLLPQLALPANRMMIGQVRQRIREIATLGATQPQIFEGSNTLIRDFMLALARNGEADPLARVNAMILVGELLGPDRKPWKGSLESLALATADAQLPLEIRIVALAGLARQAAGGDDAFKAKAGPALAALVTSPPQGDEAATSWMLARAFELLPAFDPAAPVIAGVVRIAADGKADLDLRVRAISSLGKVAKRDGKVDFAPLVGTIRSVAVAGLERDLAAADARRFARQLTSGTGGTESGFGGPVPAQGVPPGLGGGEGIFGGLAGEAAGVAAIDEDAVPILACRRNAWRLATLADALKPETGPGGLVALLEGDAAAAALELASDLRRQARAILAQPDEERVKQSVAALKKAAPADPVPATQKPVSTAGDPGTAAASPVTPVAN